MKKLFCSICLALSLVLGGCGSGNPFVVQDQTKLVTPQEKAQGVINNVKVSLTVLARKAVADRALYNDSEWFVLKNNLLDAKEKIDAAETALMIGDELLSKEKLELAQLTITFIKKELIKEQQKEIQ
jgi:hypothetical protein